MDSSESFHQTVTKTLQKAMEAYLKCQDYSSYKVNYENTARNYSSVAKRITIEGFKGNQTIVEYLFVKTLTDSDHRNERLKLSIKFERESFMYKNVFAEFDDVQSEISADDKFPFIKCVQADSSVIILENLINKQFEDISKLKYMDLEHMTMMMSELARFHAFSFALKKRNEVIFERFIKECTDIFVAPPRVKIVYENSFQYAMETISNEYMKNKFMTNGKNILEKALRPSVPQCGVICHGDYNLRNVLFKYNKDKKPSQMVMLDFQISHYSSPVTDIFFLIASSMSTKLRDEQYNNLLEIYYASLSDFLKLLNCDVKDCYPREIFDKDFEEHFPLSFARSLVILRVLCSPEKSDNDMDQMYNDSGSIFDYNGNAEAEMEYAERINGLLNHYKSLNLL